MSVLIVLIPPRDRAVPPSAAARDGLEYVYVLSPDGMVLAAQGRASPAQLPRADSVVAVLADADVSWQRLALPRAPAARLRAALVGSLEEALLDDPDHLHFALAPGAAAGQPTWVAVSHKAWLQAHLAALEAAHVPVARVVPSSWPDEPPSGHFDADADAGAPLRLAWSHPDGVAQLRLQGTLARSLLGGLPGAGDSGARWSASPAAAAPAERWLGSPVVVMTDEQRALQATRSLWNLRQFDLAPHHRGALALRDAWQRFLAPGWRPVRIGLAALLVLQVVGLNLWASQLRGQVQARKVAMDQLLRDAHPQVRSVLDAPAQMQRETDVLRAAAGRPGEGDLESLLGAAAAAWPEGMAPATGLSFEAGRLSFPTAAWAPAQREQFSARLRAAGVRVEAQPDQSLTLSRAS
jgi:general secretion pathway protein L